MKRTLALAACLILFIGMTALACGTNGRADQSQPQSLSSMLIPLTVTGAGFVFCFVMWKRNKPRDPSQNAQKESDWRIHLIPYETFSYKRAWQSGWAASATGSCLSLGGVLLFVGGIIYFFAVKKMAGLIIGFGIGFPLVNVGIIMSYRGKYRDWLRIEAACLDREHRRIYSNDGGDSGGYTWAFRLLCRFNFLGKDYTVTPSYGRTYISENGVLRLYAKAITTRQTCFLWVNPKNPLATELSTGGLVDFLLH